MEEVKAYGAAVVAGLIGVLSRWWFNQVNTKLIKLEDQVNKNKQDIALNTQSDKEYRQHTSETLKEIKEDQKEVLRILLEKK